MKLLGAGLILGSLILVALLAAARREPAVPRWCEDRDDVLRRRGLL